MSDNLQQMINVLKLISEVRNNKTRNDLLRDFSGNVNLRKALKEIAVNVVRRKIPLNEIDKKRLRKFKKIIYDLSKTKSDRKGKQLFRQSGGFLSAILPLVLSLLPTIINGAQ